VTAWVLLLLGAMLGSGAPAAADDAQARMAARVPAILQLKQAGVVGENNQGYLEFRAAAKEGEALVAAENQDRRSAYEVIARKTGATVDQVGRRMALKRVERAGAGEWVQGPDGQWARK
jgi:uncharacterized protein YdbL (DUF1318 family)